MTGLFQFFDRYRALSRSKSVPKKVITSHGEALHGSERDPGCILFAYHMFQDESAQRRATLPGQRSQLESTREPRRSSIDNSEVMAAKALATPKDIQSAVEPKSQPPRNSLDSRPKPRLSFYFKDETPNDDTSALSAKVTSVSKEPPGNPFSGLLQRRSSDPTVVASRLSVDGKFLGKEDKDIKKPRDFKGMLKGSFMRKEPRVNHQESPVSSFDLKEEEEQFKQVPELQTEGSKKEGLDDSLHFPGQDGLGEGDEYKDFSVFAGSPKGWLESKEGSTPRLIVELKDGPQLTCKDDQRVLNDRLPGLEDSGGCIIQNDHAPIHLGFKESLNAIHAKDWRKMQRVRARKSDGREPPGLPVDGKTVASRLSLDGSSPASRQSSGMPYQSVHGRDRFLETAMPVSRRRDNSWVAASPGRTVDGTWENDLEGSRWKASGVVARLMGLDDLPNVDGAEASLGMSPMRQYPSLQQGAYYLHPEESPSRHSDDSYEVFGTDEVVTPLRKDTSSNFMSERHSVSTPPKLLQLGSPISPREQYENKGQHMTSASPKHLSVSPKHHMMESMPQVLKHQVEHKASSEGLLYSGMDQRLRQLGLKNSIQERKTLKQILEAMHLKGLLQHPPRHMDPEWKHNVTPRQNPNGAIAKSLFDNAQDRSSSYTVDSAKKDVFDVDYKDIPMYISARKARGGSAEGGRTCEVSKSPLRGRHGEASIVVMKPLNVRSASKLSLVRPSLDPPLKKRQETITVRETNASKSSSTLATPTATILETDGSVSTNIRASRSENSAVSSKSRPRARSVDSRGRDTVEELPVSVRQRRERIAARTAKVKTESGDIQLRDSPKSTRSLSPLGKRPAKSSPPARSAFGSSIGHTGDAKPRTKSAMEKGDFKSTTTQVTTRRANSSRELSKETTAGEREALKVFGRTRSDSKLVADYVEKSASSSEPWSKSKGPTEVALLRTKRTMRGGGSNDQFSSPQPVDVDTVEVRDESFEKNHLEEPCSEFLESTADSCSESQDVTLERSRNGSTITLFESRRSNGSRHIPEKLPDGAQEGYEFKLEASELQMDSDAALYIDQGISVVSMSGEPQMEKLGSNAMDSSPPGAFMIRKALEDTSGRLAEGVVEQPSPISVLNNINFQEEECTPSPKFEKTGFVSLQDCTVFESGGEQEELKTPSTPTLGILTLTGDPLKDLIYKAARSLDLDDQNSFLNKPTLEIQVPYVSDLFTPPSVIPASFSTKEDERAYVRHIMVASGVTEEATAPKEWPESGQLINTDLFDQLEEHLELRESARKQNAYLSGEERTEYLKQALDRRLLFDCVNNILERRLHPYFDPQPWGPQASFQKKPMGVKLVEEIWEELQAIHARALDDDTLYAILHKDFTQRGEKWVDFSVEIGEIGMEIEEMILDELMDATVQEWAEECSFL